MKEWTKELLEKEGYTIENAKIGQADLSMRDRGCFTLSMPITGDGWGAVYGGYVLGKGYLGATQFKGSALGIESVMRIMDTVGVDTFHGLKGEHIRVATKGWGSPVKIIGNVIKDKWFDYDTFFDKG